MADVRNLLRTEQASRRITHPNLSYTKSGLLSCLVCSLIIKSESLWEGHLRSANHKKNLQKAKNGEVQDLNGSVSKKRKMSDDAEDVRKKRKSTGVEGEDVQQDAVQKAAEDGEDLSANDGSNGVAGPAIPEDESPPSLPPAKASVLTQREEPPPPPLPQPQVDEDEWAAFEREVVPLARQNPPTDDYYSSATISAAPVTAEELVAQTNTERQQRRDAEAEDEKADEEARLVEEFEVMEGLEERVKRLKEKREALRIGVVGTGSTNEDGMELEAEEKEKPPDAEEEDEDDDSDEVDEWGFA